MLVLTSLDDFAYVRIPFSMTNHRCKETAGQLETDDMSCSTQLSELKYNTFISFWNINNYVRIYAYNNEMMNGRIDTQTCMNDGCHQTE